MHRACATTACAFDPKRDDHAYFLGLLATDGSIYETTRNRGRVSFELCSGDATVLHDLSERIHYRSHIRARRRNTNFSRDYESVTLAFHDLRFRRELAAMGYRPGPKARTVTVPQCEYDETGFWRGVIDGDGSLGVAGNERAFVSLVTGSDSLRDSYVDFVLRNCGARPNPRRNARDHIYNIVIFDEAARTLAAVLYSDASIAIPRKRTAARTVAEWVRPVSRKKIDFDRRRWTPEEDGRVLGDVAIGDLAIELRRTVRSVKLRRWRLRTHYHVQEKEVILRQIQT